MTVARAAVWSTVLSCLSHVAAQTPVPAAVAPPAVAVAPVNPSPAALAWDADMKAFKVKEGQTNFHFSFSVTNVSQSEVTIRRVHPSCGCTLVKLPAQPWTLAPGGHDSMEVAVDLRGKFGTLVKNILVDSTAGFKTLVMKIEIPGQPPMLSTSPMISRAQNIRVALVDRQAVFKGDCARCHGTPAAGKTGQALYQAVCAVCHDAPHRASMVPDLRRPKTPRDTQFWTQWITSGKEGTLMPAFSGKADSGPLNEEQIRSLVDYLDQTFPKEPVAAVTGPTGK